ncbi:hypothetical protein SB2_11840 [Methylobacterium radiotolerans]|nr:hypothetical protein SB3_11035 [Methylobacterium radiotolerans]KTS47983.1 hypothetical protein SB2_11840 [Methylobacterium radiotolerans]
MTIKGSATDILRRLRSLFPRRWAADVAPVRDAVFGGIGDSLAWLYAQQQTVKGGTRRAGAVGYLLDVDAYGFFQEGFLRRNGEADDAWRRRYTDEIFRPRVTRPAIDKALYDLTGYRPKIVELFSANDCGAYDGAGLAYAGSSLVPSTIGGLDQSLGYDAGPAPYDQTYGPSSTTSAGAGMWGDLTPYQLFVTAYRPAGGGIPNANGMDVLGGYDSGYGIRYVEDSEYTAPVSDDEIYACVARSAAAGVIAWTAIQNAPVAHT